MVFFETHFNQVGFYRKGAKYAKNSVLFVSFYHPVFLCVLCVLSETGGSPREIIPIKIGIDLRSFHWVKIVFLPSDFVEDP
jgi:hypothetical protein